MSTDQKTMPVQRKQGERALLAIASIMLIGLVGIAVYGLQAPSAADFFSRVSVGIMAAGAAVLVGSLLGFLFGIPRTLQQDRPHRVRADGEKESPDDGQTQAVDYRANTNLEQISDWLTKILVGVGLTQIGIIPDKIQQVAAHVATGLGASAGGPAFAASALLFFLISGFLFGYLWTRLFLPGAFRQADLEALATKVREATIEVTEISKKLDQVQKQARLDASALGMLQRQLNPGTESPPVSQEDLNGAIAAASPAVRTHIFSQAVNVRSEKKQDKETIARTIPIFRALVASDSKFHRNHGQLGYALKDQLQPDWQEAERELSKAIDLRGGEKGYRYYELNRAVCRINLDQEFKHHKASKPKEREPILADIRTAASAEIAFSDRHEVKEWMALNGVSDEELTKNLPAPSAMQKE